MRFLVDSSVWLEVLLDQASAAEARSFLRKAESRDLAISLYALHSVGVVLVRRGEPNAYPPFIDDVIVRGAVNILDVPIAELSEVIITSTTLQLDFDDAYQYFVADRQQIKLVSLDAHFDRTPNGRITPTAALDMLT